MSPISNYVLYTNFKIFFYENMEDQYLLRYKQFKISRIFRYVLGVQIKTSLFI